MTDAAALERQLRWEIEGVERGIARYRESISDADLADTDPGKFMMREILNGLVPTIKATQEEVSQALADRERGRTPDWWLPLLCLEAEKIGFLTARVAVNRATAQFNAMTSTALAVANAVKTQREFDLWKGEQAEKGRERARAIKAGMPHDVAGPVDLYKVMTSRVKKIDARTARKWMKKSEEFDVLDWPQDTGARLGLKLLELLIAHSNGWFTVEVIGKRQNRRYITERHLTLTDKGREFINQRHAMSELTRPWLLPMLCPPNDWRIE